MDTAAPRPAPTPGLPRAALFLLVAGFIGYAVFLARFSASIAAGSDSSGYFNSARLLGEGRFFGAVRMPAGHRHDEFGLGAFMPLGFIVHEDAPLLAPTYPTGLPLHLLAASAVAGWRHAATVVNVFAALGSGFLLWSLARRLNLSPGWAAGAVALLWSCPLTLFASMQPMSDALAMLWSLTALAAALRGREHWRWCVLAGAATALAVLVRPTNALLVLPLALALGWNWRRHLPLVLGGLPGAVFLCYYNWRVYGSPLATGYGDVWSAFAARLAPHNLTHFVRWIPDLLSPLVCVALTAPLVPAARRREFAALGLWAGLLIGLYALYYHSGETWWYLRFILPAFPVLILAAFVVLQRLGQAIPWPHGNRLMLVAVLAFGLVWQVRLNRRLEVLNFPTGETCYLATANWAQQHLPPESAIFCMQVSGAFYYYTPFLIIRWDQMAVARLPELLAALRAEKRPVYAVLHDFESREARERLGGSWRQIATVCNATIWQLEAASAAP
ncbi:MAG: glycosyltransferase family 39 protein [Opitutae bacterium]|nr:glycosyltransferase family 39 protein [Opitutae bacterium]